jgi:2-oxopent-4-enoate/cis-2-oxohex-4-enoate hydratase
VTREHVCRAVAAVAPAFEIVDLRGNMAADMPLGVADNVSQWAYVTGPELRPYPANLDLGQVTAVITRNGATVTHCRGAEVIDHQLQSIAWLANALAEYDVALAAGQQIMTGSFTKPLPVAPDERWETHFSSVGTVTTAFV